MKYLILLLLCSCNFLGETQQDDDFVVSIPHDSLILWLDASKPESIEDDGANGLSTWRDLSDNHYNLTPFGTKPWVYTTQINGLNAVDFWATGDYMTTPAAANAASNYTFIAIVQPNYATGVYNILRSTAAISLFQVDTMSQKLTWSDGVSTSSILAPTITNRPMVISFVLKDVGVYFYLDGANISNNGTYAPITITGNLEVGAQGFGYIGELFFYDRALQDGERKFLEYYLMNKWGI